MKYRITAVLFCSLLMSCMSYSIEEIAGDWTVEDWPLSDTTQAVGTVRIQIDAGTKEGLLFDVPDNDWGYEDGDVAFFEFVEDWAPLGGAWFVQHFGF